MWRKPDQDLNVSYDPPANDVNNSLSHYSEVSRATSKFSQVKSKLYMRMVLKLTEKFGNSLKTVNIIKQTLDKSLQEKSYITKQMLDAIETEIENKL